MKKIHFLLFLAFVEGASVMACELMSAKLVAPFFGSSLYVWASVMGVTLFGLMSGYYLGGYLSEKIKHHGLVFWILLVGGVFLAIMPYSSVWIMKNTIDMSVKWGSTISLLVFMFPPLILMGMSSPVIINMINTRLDETGKSAGKVYAISTLGGILATYLVGFYLMPEFGIKWPSFVFGGILTLLSVYGLLTKKNYASILGIMPLFFVYVANAKPSVKTSEDTVLVHESEGILGQIRVYDKPYHTPERGTNIARVLTVNNIGQSTAFRDNLTYDVSSISYFFPAAVSMFPAGSDALLLGLGGGTIVHQYKRLGFNLDVVEIDERIKETAINYFGVSPETNIIIDDARRFINISEETYDVITFDMFLNEMPPAQVMTIETFKKVKKMLTPGGLVVLNYFGHTAGKKGLSARSVLKTLKAAGFHVEIMSPPYYNVSTRNIVFLASHKPISFEGVGYQEPGLTHISDIKPYLLDLDTIKTQDAYVLTDKKPIFDKIYIEASTEWRRLATNYTLKPIIDAKIELVK